MEPCPTSSPNSGVDRLLRQLGHRPAAHRGGTIAARDIWLSADLLVSVRLARVEARAALAQANRAARISAQHLRLTTHQLEGLFRQLELVDLDDALIRHAADLAETQKLGPTTPSISPLRCR